MNRVQLSQGEIYQNKNGSFYKCLHAYSEWAMMERTKDGWTLIAHRICQYPDGTIEWDYSTGGHWPY